jgi:NAD(P)-dependent dehydrogenase (short-subunit alcohol dehydrogenase family)
VTQWIARYGRERSRWSESDIPDLTGRIAVVTGANSGIGLETAAALAGHGARVVLACRNQDRARAAAQTIRARHPGAGVDVVSLDTSDLASVRTAAQEIIDRTDKLDLLINNAGVAWPPYGVSPQGIEMQFATNYLGHFALTGLLLGRLLNAPSSRVVSLTSLAHRVGRLDLDDLSAADNYRPFGSYAQSKLAILLFTAELQRRLDLVGSRVQAMAAHPGGARTDLLRHQIRPASALAPPALMRRLFQFQGAEMGALPTLRAAVDPLARGGECFAPGGRLELRGHPDVGRTSRRSSDPRLAVRLWVASETATAISFALPH